MGIELANLLPKVATLEIVDPHGAPTGVTLEVVGQDSTQFMACAEKWAQHRIDNPDKKPSVSEQRKQNAELLASCIVGWSGLSDTPYSAEKALELMLNPAARFIAERVEEFVSKRTNFFSVCTDATA